jgi:lipoyl(octanoyl) transferase
LQLRFLPDEPADGPHNMAVDEALFRTAQDGETATLRLYAFQPTTVTFGYRQPLSEALDPDACRGHGIDWVRRPTGGRALLHQHELTYSIASPATGVFQRLSARDIYYAVNAALRRALADVGVPLDDAGSEDESDPEPPRGTPCLAVPRRHELTSGGRKIVASAQRRSPRAFLQHGVFLFRVDEDLWARISPANAPSFPLQAVGIESLARNVTKDALGRALRAAVDEAFGVSSVQQALTVAERLTVEELDHKYRSMSWNVVGSAGRAAG